MRRIAATDEPALIVDVEGFEGPLDVLLTLARQQKVDLAKISILALADQYLAFIEEARQLRLELAADYLVMAAWLAYLKSRLLLPEAARRRGRERRGHGAGAGLRLRRLEAFREVASQLIGRPQLDRDVFARGAPEPIAEIKQPEWSATLYDLLSAYALQRSHSALSRVRFKAHGLVAGRGARRAGADDRAIVGLVAHRPVPHRLRRGPGAGGDGVCLRFATALELVREGIAEMHQKESFAPLYMRKRVGGNRSAATHDTQENA